MRLHICAIGRLKSGPEKDLYDDYVTRFDRTGRALGLGPLNLHQLDDRKAPNMKGQGELLRAALPAGAQVCALDERGTVMSSPDFAGVLADLRDRGTQDLAFIIGGADGIDPTLRADANMALSFGKMVWPHMLVRVMLAEQIYRAASILAGSPYHRV